MIRIVGKERVHFSFYSVLTTSNQLQLPGEHDQHWVGLAGAHGARASRTRVSRRDRIGAGPKRHLPGADKPRGHARFLGLGGYLGSRVSLFFKTI